MDENRKLKEENEKLKDKIMTMRREFMEMTNMVECNSIEKVKK